MAEQPSLPAVTADLLDAGELFRRLDALRDDLQVVGVGEVDDRSDDRRLPAAGCDVLGEAAVDLEEVQRQPLQRVQAGVPGAEVVQADPDAGVAQSLHAGDRRPGRVEQRTFGEFDAQRRSWQSGVGQGGGDPLRELPGGDVAVAQVDPHEQRRIHSTETGLVGQCLPQHPSVQLSDEAGVLCHGQELTGSQCPAGPVADSEQPLGSQHLPVADPHDRLVQQVHVLPRERQPQRALDTEPAQGPSLQFAVEELVPIPATVLGPVQGEVGLVHQILDGLVGSGGDRDPHAHREQQALLVAGHRPADLERLAQHDDEALGELVYVLGARQTLSQYDELVAAVAGDAVRRAAGRHQALRRGDEHLVPHPVAQRVIDPFEVIQVDKQHGDSSRGAFQSEQGATHAVGEHCAVRRTGQRIGLRLTRERVLCGPASVDVPRVADDGEKLSGVAVPDLLTGAFQPTVGPVGAAEPGRDREDAGIGQEVVQAGPQPLHVVGMDELVDVAPDHVLRPPAEDRLPCR
ncbi:MAG: hypothetical protein M3500_13590 [Actinomycetota bacterium]|nr:hypothetical protein [Actinomycetota bacterium]